MTATAQAAATSKATLRATSKNAVKAPVAANDAPYWLVHAFERPTSRRLRVNLPAGRFAWPAQCWWYCSGK
ncbi:MAG: hypothetical protein ACRYG5_04010 [Janthinobacterium lividum]